MRSTHIFLKIDVRHQDPWSRAPEYDAMTQVVCDCDVRVGPCFGGTFYAESGFSISPEGTRTDPLTACSYCSDLLRGARRCSALLGTARNCSELLGTARRFSELLETARSCPGFAHREPYLINSSAHSSSSAQILIIKLSFLVPFVKLA